MCYLARLQDEENAVEQQEDTPTSNEGDFKIVPTAADFAPTGAPEVTFDALNVQKDASAGEDDAPENATINDAYKEQYDPLISEVDALVLEDDTQMVLVAL